MKKVIMLALPLLCFAPTVTFYCDHGWGYYYWLLGPIGPNQSEGMAAAGYQSVEYRGYVQFDLYAYPGNNTLINSLVLRLRNNTGGSGLQVDLNRVVSETPDWQECGGTAPIYATNLTVNDNAEEYTYFDLSGTQAADDFLAAWQAGDWFGLGMKGSRGTGEPCMHFFYAFWANEVYDAALIIDYGIVGVEEHQDPGSNVQDPKLLIEPNPVCDVVTIRLETNDNSREQHTVTIYDDAGMVVKQINLQSETGNRKSVVWNCTDRFGQHVPLGVYFVTLKQGHKRIVEKIVVLR